MPKLKIFGSALLISFMLSACAPSSSMRIMATWVNQKDMPVPQPGKHKIFIFAMTQNYDAQLNLETDLAAAAEAKGIKTVKSIDAFGPIVTLDQLPKTDVLLKAIRDLGCDGIFTIAVVDQEDKTHYVEGSSSSVFVPYAGYGYYYSGYYAYTPNFYAPGYYSTSKTYYIESNLFNANTEKMLISMQSKVANPPDIVKASKQYTTMLVTELQAHGLMKD
jgi:curli biogenesis system outer membrane secretion channel CsgG